MNKERWQQLDTIVNEVLALNSDKEQKALIEYKCRGDESLKTEVLQFLDSIESSKDAWEGLLFSNRVLMADLTQGFITSHFPKDESIPNKLGLYNIKERLGRGGMGEVFLAERSGEEFHKNVALKVLRKEINSDGQVKRFVQERSILSSLSHPHIAQMLDGGLSEDGRPFYVMEYVEGLTITAYCKKHTCSLSERLTLFSQVCQAVQYAHTNFVVHRDIKPANLLVTQEGKVKVLDFGIAKLLDQKITQQTMLETQAGNRMLSLNYAAPEQVTLQPITTATDVYAIGLLLYELLTDCKAFDLSGKNLLEAEQVIRNKDPKKPSEATSIFPKKLQGDLDAIVMKAIRKEPKQRYETVSQLLEDINRFRNRRPVQARKGTLKYKLQKFIRRNYQQVAVTLIITISIVIFGTYHYSTITQEREQAELEAQKARRVTGILVGIFEHADPWQQPNSDITAREILKNGLDFVQDEVTDSPEIKAEMYSTFGNIYESLGDYQKADSLLRQAIQIEESLYADEEDDIYNLALHKHRLGIVNQYLNKNQEAKQLFKEASEGFAISGTPIDVASSELEWSWVEYTSGNFDFADSLASKSLQTFKEEGDSTISTSRALSNLGWIEYSKGNYSLADSLFSESIAIKRSNYSGAHPDLARTLHSLAWIKYTLKDYELAESLQQESIDMRQQVFKNQPNFDVAWGFNNMGLIMQRQGKLDKAEEYLKDALAMRKKILPPTHPHIAQTLGNLGSLYFYQEQYDQSVEIFKEVVEFERQVLPENNTDLAMSLNNLGTVLSNTHRDSESIIYFKEALSILETKLGDTHPNVLLVRDNLADSYEDLTMYKEAEKIRLRNLEAMQQKKGNDDPQTQSALRNVISLYEKWDKGQEKRAFQKLLIQSD